METVSRRRILIEGALVAATACAPNVAWAEGEGAKQVFLEVSKKITGGKELDKIVGQAIYAELNKTVPAFDKKLEALNKSLPQVAKTEEALASALQKAWYFGVVDQKVVAYEKALMFAVVAGVTPIRTYCPNQPGFWALSPAKI